MRLDGPGMRWSRGRSEMVLHLRAFAASSSTVSFDGWTTAPRVVQTDERLVVSAPTFWLLTVGWRRHGLIDPDEVPAAARLRSGREDYDSRSR